MSSPQTPEAASKPARLVSLDAYRGFVMLLMASDGLGLGKVAESHPGSGFWEFIDYQTSHAQWVGCALWDLIQPSFMFMVGVAMPFSLAARQAKGDGIGKMFGHALWRAFLLCYLGIFLRSVGRSQANFTFEDVLTQIGLGYPFLFLIAWLRPRTQAIWAGVILVGCWLAFAMYPLPPDGFDPKTVGVSAEWAKEFGQTGFAAHWNKNTNLAHAFDVWFMNLWPREKPFLYNGGGYLTLSFVPSLATMIFGLLVGGLLKGPVEPAKKVKTLVIAGVAGLVVGWGMQLTGICPVVKRIWTPSWAIFAAGWTCLLTAFFYSVVDVKQRKNWAFPMIVVGMNSIAMYCLAHLIDGFIAGSLRTHLGQGIFLLMGKPWEQFMRHGMVLGILWLIIYWMWRRKLFLKI